MKLRRCGKLGIRFMEVGPNASGAIEPAREFDPGQVHRAVVNGTRRCVLIPIRRVRFGAIRP